MNRAEFESKLSDYVRGELSAAEARQIETYLAEHPEAADDLEAVRTVLELSADIGTAEPSDALLAAARTNALEAIRAEEDEHETQRAGFWQRLPRPVYLSGLAAMLAGVVFGVLWQGSTTVWAEVVAEVRKLHSVRVEGWFRGEQGEQVPMQQWIRAPHFFRAEVGTGAARREVVVNDASARVYMHGVWYGRDLGAESTWSIADVAEQLALPEREQLETRSYQIEREDRGSTVLFSIWGHSSLGSDAPSDIRFEVEVDTQTRLPSQARVYLDVGQEDWELVSELNYLDYDVPLADELFAVADDAVQPFALSAYKAHLFDMTLEPFVPWNRTFYMPLDGMDIIIYPPSDDPSKGTQSHAASTIVVLPSSDDPSKGLQDLATSTVSGITRSEFHRTPLTEIAQSLGLGKMRVETPDSALAKQRYSARIAYNHRLTPTERVQRLGRRFGFVAELEKRQGARTRWIFTQDGSEFPTNPQDSQQSGTKSQTSSSGKSYTFHAKGYPLKFAVQRMLTYAASNDLVEGYDQDLDEIELQWDDAAADNPFERPVDVEVDFSDGWDVALDYLREQFGVAMERVSEPITYEVLVMRPHSEGAK